MLNAKFITDNNYQKNIDKNVSAPIFVKTFSLKKNCKTAFLNIACLGYGYVEINFKKIRGVLLTPQSNYSKSIFYDKIDITDFLQIGENIITIELGNGFYNDFVKSTWQFDVAPWRDALRCICQINIAYEDCNEDIISDQTFNVINSGVYFNSIRNGEYYDARVIKLNKDNYKELIKQSKNAILYENNKAKLILNEAGLVIESEILVAEKIIKNRNSYVFCFSKNISGYGRLKLRQSSGSEVKLVYGEQLFKNMVDQSNINVYNKEGLFQTDILICSGNEDEFYPKHTYHGFMYIEIFGLETEPNFDTLKAVFIHQDINRNANFNCSNKLFNKIYQASINSSYSNMIHTITDCPTREKLGWTGDMQMSTEQMLYNFDISGLHKKIMKDIKDSITKEGKIPGIAPTGGWGYSWGNGPTFDAAIFEIPYQNYLIKGDKNLLIEYNKSFEKYLGYLKSNLNKQNMLAIGLGDWTPPQKKQDAFDTSLEFTDTLYYLYFLKIMMLSCELANKNKNTYAEDFFITKDSFKKKYIIDKKLSCLTETALAFIIDLELFEEYNANFGYQLEEVIKMNNYKLTTGIIGARHIFRALTKTNKFDVCYKLLTQEDFPSYGYLIKNNTNLVETWFDDMSKNHHMFSDISIFYIKYIAGLDLNYKDNNFYINLELPYHKYLNFAMASYKSLYGKISIEWQKNNKNNLEIILEKPKEILVNFKILNLYNITATKINDNIIKYICESRGINE